jgi:spermidine synthase
MVLPALILAYGALTLTGQVLLLREMLVLAQGQELKLALGLWCWLGLTGAGSLLGGRWVRGRDATPGHLAALLGLLALLLPGTVGVARALPSLAPLLVGQYLPPLSALAVFFLLLAPFALLSGFFFPLAAAASQASSPRGAAGRVYGLESLGAALGVGVLQLMLFGRLPTLALALGIGVILLLLAALLVPPRRRSARALWGFGIALLSFALIVAPELDRLSRRLQWPGRSVAAARDSPYALLTVTREREQTSFFANRVWQFSHPDLYSAELAVHPGLLQHPAPRRVLLVGGDVQALAAEVFKYPGISRVDYVDPDPDLLQLLQASVPDAAALRDPRLGLYFQDGRGFLSRSAHTYDVVLMNLPEPASVHLNRYYTREFFALAASRLAPGGIFSFTLPGGETGLNPLRAAFLALSYHTLREIFPVVVVMPGERVRFVAGFLPEALSTDPEELSRRLARRGLALRYVREYYLTADLAPERRAYVEGLLSCTPPEVNEDLHPRSVFYDMALRGAREGLPLGGVLFFLRDLPSWWLWLGLGLMVAALQACRGPAPRALAQIMVMGLGTMTLELIVLILCQTQLGYLYRQLGLLIAAFMAGMGAGAAWGLALARRSPRPRVWLAACQGALALLALTLALSLPPLAASPQPPVLLLHLGYFLILFPTGWAGGAIFSLATFLWHQEGSGVTGGEGLGYAADLLGATLGSLVCGFLALPVWGLVPVLYALAVLHATAALSLRR